MNNTTAIATPNNKGQIVGKLIDGAENVFEVEGEKFYEGKIAVERLSNAVDLLPITISEKLIKASKIKFEKGTFLALGGELRSYNRQIDGKSRLILSFFVKEVLDSQDVEEDCTNNLTLTGYICKEPNYRVTPFNRQICDILVAVNRPNFNKSDYIPCILWGRNAKLMQSQKIGTKITLQGRIQSRNYRKEIKEGIFEEKTAYEVSCQKLLIEEKEDAVTTDEARA